MTEYRAYISPVKDLRLDIQKSLEFIGWKERVPRGSTVFIKPNFTYPFYKEGITTTPEIIRILIELLLTRAGHVIVGESDGGNHSFSAENAFQGHGMPEICRESGAELVNLSRQASVQVEESIQGKRVKVLLPKMLVDGVDCFVSVPVLKMHAMTTTTLSIKNLWGCYPDSMRCLHHKNLSHKLTLIAKTVRPKIILIDGLYALDGHGPMFGQAKKTDLVLSSNNPVAADSLGSQVMGIPISRVEHLLVSEREGLGTTDLKSVVLNDDWKKYRMSFHLEKTLIDNLSYLLFNSEIIAKCVMASPLTPVVYGIARHLRNHDESLVASELQNSGKTHQ